ncbi:MAG: c-type cytochrome [Gemmatimonadaceae bacterium]
MKRYAILALVVVSSGGCREEQVAKPHATDSVQVATVDSNAVRANAAAHAVTFPAGPEGLAAKRGFAILAATRDSLPGYVGNGLRCFSCHLDNGNRPNSIPLTGVYARYPTYGVRDGEEATIQDRINSCFRRSLAGRAIPDDSKQMHDIVTYLALVSRGVAIGAHVPGEGLPKMPPLTGDTVRGAAIFTASCARCHGANGAGIPPATPVWGPRSYSIGASLARVERAASFIRHNMPFDSAGVLNDQQAYDVASYVLSHPRPNTRGIEHDWPNGGAPSDVPYNTKGHVAFNPPKQLTAPEF